MFTLKKMGVTVLLILVATGGLLGLTIAGAHGSGNMIAANDEILTNGNSLQLVAIDTFCNPTIYTHSGQELNSVKAELYVFIDEGPATGERNFAEDVGFSKVKCNGLHVTPLVLPNEGLRRGFDNTFTELDVTYRNATTGALVLKTYFDSQFEFDA